jgi:hypothetical protein
MIFISPKIEANHQKMAIILIVPFGVKASINLVNWVVFRECGAFLMRPWLKK